MTQYLMQYFDIPHLQKSIVQLKCSQSLHLQMMQVQKQHFSLPH